MKNIKEISTKELLNYLAILEKCIQQAEDEYTQIRAEFDERFLLSEKATNDGWTPDQLLSQVDVFNEIISTIQNGIGNIGIKKLKEKQDRQYAIKCAAEMFDIEPNDVKLALKLANLNK